MEEERVDIVDVEGNRTGKSCAKSEAHRNGFLHPTIHVWILTPDNKVLIQQRSFNKNTFPGLWDVSVAGHISAGEGPLPSAVREINEELGISVRQDELQFMGLTKGYHKHAEDLIDHELHYVYFLKKEISYKDIILQQEEVEAVKFMDIQSFMSDITKNSQHYVAHGTAYFDFIFEHMDKMYV